MGSFPLALAIWKAIYKREIVPFFDEDYVCHTDKPFQDQLRKIEHSKAKLDRVLYIYRSDREGSISWLRRHGQLKNPSPTYSSDGV